MSAQALALAPVAPADAGAVVPSSADAAPPADDAGLPSRIGTWVDEKREKIQQRLDQQAQRMDAWFGPTYNPDARAGVTVFLDNTWDDHDGFDTRVRLRGSVKLPNARNRLRLVFGDDRLDEEQRLGQPVLGPSVADQTDVRQSNLPSGSQINEQAQRDNASIALRLLGEAGRDIHTDLDLGVRSGTDVYLRARADKAWEPRPDYRLHVGQTLRYGSKSRAYARTDVLVDYVPSNRLPISLMNSYSFADPERHLGVTYVHRLSQTRHFWSGQDFGYGVQASGHIRDLDMFLDRYGPFVSWRQPFLRDWFFVRGDLNYFNDRLRDHDHALSAFVRLEAQF